MLEQAAREPGAVKTESGMVLRVIEPGSGPSRQALRLRDGQLSRHAARRHACSTRNEGKPPAKSQLGATTRCWQEALGAVAAGARLHVVCPPALGYDWGGWPGVVPGGAVLSYDLELVSIEPKPPPPAGRAD